MNGPWHNRFCIAGLIIAVWYLGSKQLAPLVIGLFALRWLINTYYVTPDLDTYSQATKRLWIIGDLINMIFKHRGLLHSFKFWTVLFLVEYSLIGWLAIGGYCPVLIHLGLDKL